MTANVTIFHNSRCSKSRQTLQLLQDRGVQPTVVEYLKDPPSTARVHELFSLLGIEPHALLRKKEAAYQELGLSPASSADEIACAITDNPVLMERPVVVVGDRAALGRPPETALEIL